MKKTITKNLLRIALVGVAAAMLTLCRAADAPVAESEVTTATNAIDSVESNSIVIKAIGGEDAGEGEETGLTRRDALVVIGDNAELKANEVAEAMVVIGGNGVVKGKVDAAAVVVGGNLEIEGEVQDAAVAVMGSIKIKPGAVIHGDVVAIGGRVEKSEDAIVHGHTQEVGFGLPDIKWLQDWFVQCVLKLRPLAPQVGWVWIVAGIFFLFYLLIAVLFPKPIASCVEELNRRPATTFLLGILTKLLMPILFVILAATGLGLFVVPFILAALLIGFIVGKVALIEWMGFKIRSSWHPVLALVVGSAILCVLYMIPFLGLLVFGVTSVWGIGVAVAATFGGLKRELPEKPAAPSAPGAPPASLAPVPMTLNASTPVSTDPASTEGAACAAPSAGTDTVASGASVPFSMPAAPSTPTVPPMVPDALGYPRARFWERIGAGLIDLILVSILSIFVGGPPLGFLVGLAYFVGLWMWKGTTLGGIVLNLRVVRLDGQKLSFPVSLVRGLTGAFGLMVFFLGMLWVIWDSEKQSWQDKVAGTVVVRTPKGVPLLIL
jgi:uncharacterized RDD family membrane protein YckC/cytoskeletal protein CcmA (bactofilin family)